MVLLRERRFSGTFFIVSAFGPLREYLLSATGARKITNMALVETDSDSATLFRHIGDDDR